MLDDHDVTRNQCPLSEPLDEMLLIPTKNRTKALAASAKGHDIAYTIMRHPRPDSRRGLELQQDLRGQVLSLTAHCRAHRRTSC